MENGVQCCQAVTDAQLIKNNALYADCNSEHHKAKQVFVATHKHSTNKAGLLFISALFKQIRTSEKRLRCFIGHILNYSQSKTQSKIHETYLKTDFSVFGFVVSCGAERTLQDFICISHTIFQQWKKKKILFSLIL